MSRDVVSIEKALNSRCSGDLGPKKSHWGTFTKKRPSKEIIDNIVNCLNIPRFSDGKLLRWFENDYLYLGFEDPRDPRRERVLHIESGMQHEAVYLACAAEGVGTCIHNQGVNGTSYKERTATVRHLIMEMTDPYKQGKFTTEAPGPEKPFVSGKNLTEPYRDGEIDCTSQMSKLTTSSKTGSQATEKDTSQLLWAARGRTPHYIKTDRWKFLSGLTIPTWGGIQNLTSVYLAKNKKLHGYVSWTKEFSLMNRAFGEKLGWTRGNPTHDIRFIRNVDVDSQIDGHEEAIFLCQNEYTGRALWEIGYMLENMLLQAKSLNMSYETKVFAVDKTSQPNEIEVPNVVAAVLI